MRQSKKPPDYFTEPPLQNEIGRPPRGYLCELPSGLGSLDGSIGKIPGKGIRRLDRKQIRTLCRDASVHPLVAYACIMAWGGRDFGNFRRSLANGNAKRVIDLVKYLRVSRKGRREDFCHTQKAVAAIAGLGISFYTKFLFFLRKRPDAYILDQWTGKSSTVLFPELGVRLTSAGLPDPGTLPAVYDAYCARLEACCGAGRWGAAWTTGEEVERTLFDHRLGPWRRWLKTHLGEDPGGFKWSNRTGRRANSSGQLPSDEAIRRFGDCLRKAYNDALDAGVSLPDGCGGFARPNRIHVRMQGGVVFQFVVNQKNARAQIFVHRNSVGIYSGLADGLKPAVIAKRHDFGGGITGNGPKEGKTRAINLAGTVPGGWLSPEEEWPSISEAAVEAMAELFGFFEPYLPPA